MSKPPSRSAAHPGAKSGKPAPKSGFKPKPQGGKRLGGKAQGNRPAKASNAPLPSRDDFVRIGGLPAVQALLEARPDEIDRLFYVIEMRDAVEPLCKALAAARKPYKQVDGDELAKIAATPMHGGVVALAKPRPVVRFDAEQAKLWAKAKEPVLVLDGVGNPHNLGAIARTMAFFGIKHLLLSDHPGQALPSESAFRVAEGGLEHVTVYRADRFDIALKRLREAGYRVTGTALENARPLADLPRDRPLAVVLGNEEHGLPVTTVMACESIVKLPGSGHVQSLNVSATAAILVWEMAKRL